MLTFVPARDPSRSSPGSSFEPKVLEASFGDGYAQRTAPGINSVRETLSLTWDSIPVADGLSVVAFFAARQAVEAFLYTIPGDSDPKKWTCRKWSKAESGPGLMKITAEFRQEFDLA